MAVQKFSLSGFPEWLPEQRAVELRFLDIVRAGFERHGFMSLETRSVEPLTGLVQGGDVGKEVYALRRIHDETKDAGLGLHFDLTVPLARYVVENAGHLAFPFRRYQIQKVWRGERPQEGRFREFTQADIDIIGRDVLPGFMDADAALAMLDVLNELPIPDITMRINNRLLMEGFFSGIDISDSAPVLRVLDKLAKIGEDGVRRELSALGLSASQIDACIAISRIHSANDEYLERVAQLNVVNDDLDNGLTELRSIANLLRDQYPTSITVDLSIARGLDYYTGTVFETTLNGYESSGSICSGGRYENLARTGKTTFPGVGLSLGLTRLLAILFGVDALTVDRATPSVVLVAVVDEENRPIAQSVARDLRRRGISCEVSPTAEKFGKQIRYADRKKIPYVWFPDTNEVKDIRSGVQVPASSWEPAMDDLHPSVTFEVEESS